MISGGGGCDREVRERRGQPLHASRSQIHREKGKSALDPSFSSANIDLCIPIIGKTLISFFFSFNGLVPRHFFYK